jgi:hypothetical protein
MKPGDILYRDALLKCADRYLGMATPGGDLYEFLEEFHHKIDGEPYGRFTERGDPNPLLKLNRWLGYIQGVLIESGITTVEAERDWTRPLFRPIDFAPPSFCGWMWSEKETQRLRAAHQLRHGEDCTTETLYTVAAEAIRIWCELGMPGLGAPMCTSKTKR